jgi:hypothetical protein
MHNKFIPSQIHHHTQHQIHIEGKKHPPYMKTPQTPHGMVRRSARQKHNLSQDMMAETVSQANHCFSISAQPKPQHFTRPSNNRKVIILPEMANAVICPETGKSLKH